MTQFHISYGRVVFWRNGIIRWSLVSCIRTTRAQWYWKITDRHLAGKTPNILTPDIFIKDQIKAGELRVKWCSIDDTIGEFFAKPMQGNKFTKFRKSSWDTMSSKHVDRSSVLHINYSYLKFNLLKHLLSQSYSFLSWKFDSLFLIRVTNQ